MEILDILTLVNECKRNSRKNEKRCNINSTTELGINARTLKGKVVNQMSIIESSLELKRCEMKETESKRSGQSEEGG